MITRVAYVNYVNKENGNDKKYSADELLDAYTKLAAGDDSMKEKLNDFHRLLKEPSEDFGSYDGFLKKVINNEDKIEEQREDKL